LFEKNTFEKKTLTDDEKTAIVEIESWYAA